jgi:hypothetical protein
MLDKIYTMKQFFCKKIYNSTSGDFIDKKQK